MSGSTRPNVAFWATPLTALAGGLAFFLAAWHAGDLGPGLGLLAIMVVFTAGVLLASRRSETVRGLLDRRDERITAIDLRATAVAGTVTILAVLVGAVMELARGHTGAPYTWLAALSGGAYLVAVVVARLRR